MKRDRKLIKKILEYVEKHGDGTAEGICDLSQVVSDITGKGIIERAQRYSFTEIHYHAWLCVNAGFVVGKIDLDPKNWAASYLSALTWKGHDMLDGLRHLDEPEF